MHSKRTEKRRCIKKVRNKEKIMLPFYVMFFSLSFYVAFIWNVSLWLDYGLCRPLTMSPNCIILTHPLDIRVSHCWVIPMDIPSDQKQLSLSSFHCERRRGSNLLHNGCSSCATWSLCRAPVLHIVPDIPATSPSYVLFLWNHLERPETFCACRLRRPLHSRILLLLLCIWNNWCAFSF